MSIVEAFPRHHRRRFAMTIDRTESITMPIEQGTPQLNRVGAAFHFDSATSLETSMYLASQLSISQICEQRITCVLVGRTKKGGSE